MGSAQSVEILGRRVKRNGLRQELVLQLIAKQRNDLLYGVRAAAAPESINKRAFPSASSRASFSSRRSAMSPVARKQIPKINRMTTLNFATRDNLGALISALTRLYAPLKSMVRVRGPAASHQAAVVGAGWNPRARSFRARHRSGVEIPDP